ncbi:MAG TPA: hypothetical protein DDW17_05435 [Deltaproteobacteria bacterium]|nr:hypothetical protein [Deltaproteobacteria bacterium]
MEERINILCEPQHGNRLKWFRGLLSARLVSPLPLSMNIIYGNHKGDDSQENAINLMIPAGHSGDIEAEDVFNRFKNSDWISRANNNFILNVDIVGFALWILNRVEEDEKKNDPAAWDKHGRFRVERTLAYKHGLSQKPVLDILLKQLIETIEKGLNTELLNRAPWGKGYGKAVWLTHDVDKLMGRYWLVLRIMGWIAFSLKELIRGDLKGCHAWLKKTVKWMTTRKDPTYESIEKIVEFEGKTGAKSTFFFMSLRNGISFHEGIRYPIKHPKTHTVIKMLLTKGWEIGLHPAYARAYDSVHLSFQKRGLEGVMDRECQLMRNHYLRAKFPDSWYLAEKVGFLVTSNMGWSSTNGFRAGTCWPYRPFDIENDRPSPVIEVPLIYMDSGKKGSSIMVKEMLSLAHEAADVHGLFTVNFHSSIFDEFDDTARNKIKAYMTLLEPGNYTESFFIDRQDIERAVRIQAK